MEPVVGGPPEHALLKAQRSTECEDELEWPAGLVRTVREVAMEPGREKKHSCVVEPDCEHQAGPRPAEPNDAEQGHRMDTPEWK
jgi:hypothetical protein